MKYKDLSMKLASYTALTATFMALKPAVINAAEVYTDINPDVLLQNTSQSYSLDLNGDFINDFQINFNRSFFTAGSYYQSANVHPLGINAILNDSNGVDVLSSSFSINAAANFNNGGFQNLAYKSVAEGGFYSFSGGPFLGETDKFVGLKFSISGQTHYGWLRLSIDASSSSVIIKDYAYESTPNTAITIPGTNPPFTCDPPSSTSTSNIKDDRAVLNWSLVQNAIGYELEGKRVGAANTIILTVNNGSTILKSVGNLTSGKTYKWRMQSVCDSSGINVNSSYTPWLQFTTVKCNPVDTLFTSNVSSSTAVLNWSSISNAHSYKISGRPVGASKIISVVSFAPDTVRLVAGLNSNKTYEWAVQTTCENNVKSEFSAINMFTTSSPKISSDNNNYNTNDILVFPNPANLKTTVRFPESFDFKGTMKLYDAQGKLVREQEVSANKVVIYKNELTSGVYFGEIGNQKFKIIFK